MTINPNAVFLWMFLALVSIAVLITAPAYVWIPLVVLGLYTIYAIIP